MKNANISRLGGFTLIELLVVVLIIGILAAMAMPQYFKAVERSRMTEAVTLVDSIVKSQRRHYMQTNRYTEHFEGLDVTPKGARGNVYYSKGNPTTGAGGNGFKVVLGRADFWAGNVIAYREINGNQTHSSLQYIYHLERSYQNDNTTCGGINQAGKELCADFCGIDTPVGHCCNDGTAGYCS